MDGSEVPLIGTAVFLALLLAEFILSGFSSALETVTESSLEQAGRREDPRAGKILEWKDHPQRLAQACWFYDILLGCVGSYSLIRALYGPDWAVLAAAAAAMYLFGRGIPQLIGKKYAVGWCMQLFQPVRGLVAFSVPFTRALTAVVHVFVRIFGVNPHLLEDEVTEDEIISMVNEGHEQGVLDEHEAEMIQNIFELNDKEAQDIMTHRKNISAINGRLNLQEAISAMLEEPNSRFPVYEENIDNIIGVLHLKDAMIFHNKGQYDDWLVKDIPELLRPIRFIPETRSIDRLFRSMQAQKLQMVIVVDEYGETAGLVTMEDILEEIVGNILDEYDEDERFILPEADGSFRMAGMTPLEDVAETLGISFEDEDYDTLNGYLIYRLDRIPEEDEDTVIEEQGYSFQILEVDNKTIKWVRVSRLPDRPSDGEAGADEPAKEQGPAQEKE